MPKFKNNILKKNICIHCDTENKARALLKWGHTKNLSWNTEHSFLDLDINWKSYKEDTVYYLYEEAYGELKYAKSHGHTVISYEDAIDYGITHTTIGTRIDTLDDILSGL